MCLVVTDHAKIMKYVTALWSREFESLPENILPITTTREWSTRGMRFMIVHPPKLEVRERALSDIL